MKKLIVVFIIVFLAGCLQEKDKKIKKLVEENKEPTQTDIDFTAFCDELIAELLKGDPLSINFYIRYPEAFGLDEEVYEGITYEENNNEYKKYLEDHKQEIADFDSQKMMRKNALAQEILIDYFDDLIGDEEEDLSYYDTNLSNLFGYQSNIPILLAMYRFDDLDDIINYFSYFDKLDDDFQSILAFEYKKIDLGLSLTDDVLNEVIAQCEEIIEAESFFLEPIFEEKIANMGLDNTQELIARNKACWPKYVGAYQNLLAGIKSFEGKSLLGSQEKSGACWEYEKGEKYYEILLRDSISSDVSIKEVLDNLEKAISDEMNGFISFAFDTTKSDFSKGKSYEDMLEYYINNESLWEDFPQMIKEWNYQFSLVPSSLEDSYSPAAYFVSPFDADTKEQMIINKSKINEADGNYMYTVIAHEGVPGHMYQNAFFKESNLFNPIRMLFDYSGYTEGWANYIELYALKYSGYSEKYISKYISYERYIGYVVSYLDIKINYDGWSIKQVENFLDESFLNKEVANEIYNQLIQTPTNYLEYYYGMYQILKLKEGAKEYLGKQYSDYAFHSYLLNMGPCSFDILHKHLKEIAYYI